ncbi:MAG: hypothetical protein OXF09_08550 [Hyphomicrobiales bacterium]|nr:hypothetical protein [Hyphomicrobiales bacterium]
MKVSGKAIIKIHGTDQTYEIEGDDLHFEEVERHERANGIEKHYVANIENLGPSDKEGTFELSVWEYPEGIYNTHNFDVGENEI